MRQTRLYVLVLIAAASITGAATQRPERFQAIAKWPMLSHLSWTPPTLAGNRLYVRDRRVLVALDLSAIK